MGVILTHKMKCDKIGGSLKDNRWNDRKSVVREESPGSVENGSR